MSTGHTERGDEVPHVVIVGGGFAGFHAAKALVDAPVRITLLDRRNHHLFQPLLYQVATAGLAAPDIAAPLRGALGGHENLRVLMAEVRDVDLDERRIELDRGSLEYDFLLLATGSRPDYFGNDDWQSHAPGLKSLEDALELRSRLLAAFEAAEREDDPGVRRGWLSFAIVGAGPTGVELAAALRDIAQRTLAGGFRSFDPARTRVVLLEADERVLSQLPPRVGERARDDLEALGVEVRTGAPVTDVDEAGVTLEGGERVEARTVIWSAGVAPSPLGERLGEATDRSGRILVEPDLSLPEHPEVLAAGDLAATHDERGEPVPALAAAAIQEGKHAARMIRATLRGQPREPFRYRDRGMLVAIGKRRAVGTVLGRAIAGWPGWLAWAFVHVAWLVGFRSRLSVLLDWAWAYLTHQRAARVILFRSGSPVRRAHAEKDP